MEARRARRKWNAAHKKLTEFTRLEGEIGGIRQGRPGRFSSALSTGASAIRSAFVRRRSGSEGVAPARPGLFRRLLEATRLPSVFKRVFSGLNDLRIAGREERQREVAANLRQRLDAIHSQIVDLNRAARMQREFEANHYSVSSWLADLYNLRAQLEYSHEMERAKPLPFLYRLRVKNRAPNQASKSYSAAADVPFERGRGRWENWRHANEHHVQVYEDSLRLLARLHGDNFVRIMDGGKAGEAAPPANAEELISRRVETLRNEIGSAWARRRKKRMQEEGAEADAPAEGEFAGSGI